MKRKVTDKEVVKRYVKCIGDMQAAMSPCVTFELDDGKEWRITSVDEERIRIMLTEFGGEPVTEWIDLLEFRRRLVRVHQLSP